MKGIAWSIKWIVLLFLVALAGTAAAQGFERRDVMFPSKGLKCAAWYYVPKNLAAGEKRPTIVMAHGWTATKEMYLDNFASKFADAGFVVLVFDYRFLGGSEGEPRGQVIWYEQTEDYQNAITWATMQPEADPQRIGLWGSSYSGGHVLYVAAYDKRVKALVSQVPFVYGWPRLQRFVPAEQMQGFFEWLIHDRAERAMKGTVNYIAVVAPSGEPSSLPTKESYEWFTEASKRAPKWINKVTIESIEKLIQYNPAADIRAISPAALLMIVASNDTIVPTDQEIEVYERALEPKSLVVVPGAHFEAYEGPKHQQFAGPAVDWFKKYLMK
jgi:uncharacterized protein